MEGNTLILIGAGLLLVAGGIVGYVFLLGSQKANVRSLMGDRQSGLGNFGAVPHHMSEPGPSRGGLNFDDQEREIQRFRQNIGESKKKKLTLEEKYFMAGMFSEEEKTRFGRLRVILPIVGVALGVFLASSMSAQAMLIGAIIGGLVGMQLPTSIIDRRIQARDEEIMYYLPLVIEQIAIGVSSSLDIGPCLQRIVQMADERDTHNAVTELVKLVQHYMKQGVSMEESLIEIGKRSGHTELKHSFMSLSQVAKHGGEITRQLQELADAVSSQRETRIEGKIKKLELEATGPVALVFFAFLTTLLTGFGLQIMKAFQ